MTYTIEVVAPPLIKTQTELASALSASATAWVLDDPDVIRPGELAQLFFWSDRQERWVPDEVIYRGSDGAIVRGAMGTFARDHRVGTPVKAMGPVIGMEP